MSGIELVKATARCPAKNVSSISILKSDRTHMSVDHRVANPGRLSILTALAVEEKADFVPLRQQTQLTDGNLASHARRLASAGLISIEKSFRNGKATTSLTLTMQGR